MEYPYNYEEHPEHHDFDPDKAIGMLTVARAVLIENELEMRREEDD